MVAKKKYSRATHKARVKRLERIFCAPVKRNKRGIYIVDLPNDHPILKKLEKKGKVGMLIKGKRRKLIDL